MRPAQPGDTGRGPNHPTQAFRLEPLFITMEELQRVLACGKTTAFALTHKTTGKIETVFQGKRRKPVWESVKAYAESLRESA